MAWTRSLLKYPGGKYNLLPEIEKILPSDHYDLFAEPFMGGGSVAFNLGRRYSGMVLNDANADVIQFWRSVADRPSDLANTIKSLAETRSKSDFLKFRDVFNTKSSDLTDIDRAAIFYYLNKECFNGLIRYNSKGNFNVPYGKYKNFKHIKPEHLQEISTILNNNVTLSSVDYQKFIYVHLGKIIKQGQKLIVYIDPPYLPISKTSNFTSYWKPFGVQQHEELKLALDFLDSNGVPFILSNSASSETKRIFNTYKFREVMASRNISCKGDTRGKISEYLITNF